MVKNRGDAPNLDTGRTDHRTLVRDYAIASDIDKASHRTLIRDYAIATDPDVFTYRILVYDYAVATDPDKAYRTLVHYLSEAPDFRESHYP
jgi:hypothetical protein